MVPALLVLALEYRRAPIRFGHLTDPMRPLPERFGDWLAASSAALAPANIEATAEALGTEPEALREAFLFLLRQVLMAAQADHYRVLGLSRGCASEAIKQHYGLLVRQFHPDRMGDGDARGGVLTARINAAYQTLRDPQARQGYDRGLAPSSKGAPPPGDGWEFFRPRDPVEPVAWRTRVSPASPTRSRLSWLLAGAPVAALVLLVVEESAPPVLRVNAEHANSAPAGPAYLRVAEAQTGTDTARAPRVAGAVDPEPGSLVASQRSPGTQVPTGTGATAAVAPAHEAGPRRGLVESGGAQPESRAGAPAGPPKPKAVKEDQGVSVASPAFGDLRTPMRHAPPGGSPLNDRLPPEKPDPAVQRRPRVDVAAPPAPREATQPSPRAIAQLVDQLERSFANGDLAGLASLFAANAVVDGGVGAAGVRATYADLLAEPGQRRLTITSLKWRHAQDQRLRGHGTLRIGNRSEGQAAWRDRAGTIELELVPSMGDYRISRLIHHPSLR